MQQGGKVFPNLSIWDNLQLAAQGGNGQWSMANNQLIDIVPLLQQPKEKLQHLMTDKLSGGQKHQLSLAMTLATNPRLVILDEPSAGLSPKSVEEMYKFLHDVRLKLNVTTILIEQNIAKAVKFCNRSIMISQGSITQIYSNDIKEIEKMMFNLN